ncbi:4-alpha-glucanotransferase [Arsenicitalea aurantiaca]|uniref:4-alpha-glucanotransferase n=1 Tax=Arsenicitalea aurantiaca TaxID=1783274 RepID=A0A433XL86_9HYPH|nr:4-alpha-glucanotransferase [Arsenicitalea aurantiaca]RUT34840.1 4-alpha-glucanotransferase [Arsenicitalea aurantiaca]
MNDTLDALASRYHVMGRYWGIDGTAHDVPEATRERILAAMGMDVSSPEALARALAEAPDDQPVVMQLRPGTRCFVPDWLEEGKCWGIAIQLYAVRSERNWGIGDYADLARLGAIGARAGADFLGTNPLHAPFMADPNRRSPFFPSTRRFLNPLYIAVDDVPGFDPAMVDGDEIARLRALPAVDYVGVAALKRSALRQAFDRWRTLDGLPEPYRHADFEAFRTREGVLLERHGLFEALSEAKTAEGLGSGWEGWPEPLHDPESAEVATFAVEHAAEVRFHVWLQFLASVQLEAAQAAAIAAGMRVGLYLDFAVGEAPDGSGTWSNPSLCMRGVSIGAPPDYFATDGQDWGLAPLSPAALDRHQRAPFRDMMASSMRYAGALRIDHAMALWQLFLVPHGEPPSRGTYVRYPIEEMVGVVAQASHAHRTVVIGEDLGNVPEGFRDLMEIAAILSYRILYFERNPDGFIAPWDYPREALACLSTHDLPTIVGWWRGDDMPLRETHGLMSAESAARHLAERATEREQLLAGLVHYGIMTDADADAARRAVTDRDADLPEALVLGVHVMLARTPSRMLAVRLEDLVGQRDPVNLPGTVDAYPNWQIKLPVALEDLEGHGLFLALTGAMARERPR